MWDGPDGMGFDSVGDAMRCVAMQDDATPCHATPWDWMEFDGMGSDAMRRDAMGLNFSTMDGVDWLWLVARWPLAMAQCSAARSSVFDDGAVIRCSLVGFDRYSSSFYHHSSSIIVHHSSIFIILCNPSPFIRIHYHSSS